jgi:hypothetical protein
LELVHASSAADYRDVLEKGNILFFPEGGFQIPEGVLTVLNSSAQDARAIHKNIAYKPNRDQISGLGSGSAEHVLSAMREYSRRALEFLRSILPEYSSGWKVDYASFRSIEERGRELPLNKRNDLLHVDSFPTRPVFGDLILRCFTNVNPAQSREWLVADPFPLLAEREARNAGLDRFGGRRGSPARLLKRGLNAVGLPVVDRSPYDAFMLHFHDWLKANHSYQENCNRYRFDLPPGSTWLVFTDVVPHAVLGGRLAMEQTVIVSRASLRNPELAPASILERMTGRELTR